jgi:cytochrome c oxidase assembly protein subunit 15
MVRAVRHGKRSIQAIPLMMSSALQLQSRRRLVRAWLLAVAALVFLTAAVGGGTRLTGSGLSIVEWRPVTGTVPPLSQAAWQAEFEKYKTIPQYREVNRGMSLEEFKFIYWWEWGHRLLGRLIGVVFLLPFLWFLWRGWIEPGLRLRLWTIFGLGAVQGAVGWWMVSSGLADRISVSQYRLAFHLTLACVIFAMVLWVARQLKPQDGVDQGADLPPRIRNIALALVVLVLAQIYLGALVAGLRAGLIYNTWPLIDGAFIPDLARLFFEQPWWRNFFENALLVQFNHRMLAYVIFALAIWHVVDVVRTARRGTAVTSALMLASAVTLQAGLGIVTLLHVTPLPLALAHQALAVIVLAIAVMHAAGLRQAPAQQGAARLAV